VPHPRTRSLEGGKTLAAFQGIFPGGNGVPNERKGESVWENTAGKKKQQTNEGCKFCAGENQS